MTFPSIAYTLQNNLDFVALSNLNAGIYHVTTQLKIVTTAIFMMIILGRRFSGTRWLAIFLLFGGVAAVEVFLSMSFCKSSKLNKHKIWKEFTEARLFVLHSARLFILLIVRHYLHWASLDWKCMQVKHAFKRPK